jgi:hypothetical protein
MDANSNDELYPIAVLIDELKVGAAQGCTLGSMRQFN